MNEEIVPEETIQEQIPTPEGVETTDNQPHMITLEQFSSLSGEYKPASEAPALVDRQTSHPQPEPGMLQARLLMVFLGLAIILLDQYTKFLVESNLQMFEVFAPLPEYEQFFRIMHVYNTGAAFGIFPNGGLFFGIMAVIVGSLILIYNLPLKII